MKEKMDKLKSKLKTNNKLIIFLGALTLIGIISGTIFSLIINNSDKTMVSEYLKEFFENIKNGQLNALDAFKNALLDNYSQTLLIWLLGISIIGIPVVLILFFSKSFIIGFTIGSIMINYKLKGCLISLIYIFPHQILNVIFYLLLLIYSLALSFKLIFVLIKRKTIDFKPIMNKYLMILVIALLGFLFTSLYEAFLMPKILKLIAPLL